MSAYNIARFNVPTLYLAATTASSNGQLTYSSDFVEVKNAGPGTVAVTNGSDNTVTATFPVSGTSTMNMKVLIPGEVATFRHSSRGAGSGGGGLYIAAITKSGAADVYISPVEGR